MMSEDDATQKQYETSDLYRAAHLQVLGWRVVGAKMNSRSRSRVVLVMESDEGRDAMEDMRLFMEDGPTKVRSYAEAVETLRGVVMGILRDETIVPLLD